MSAGFKELAAPNTSPVDRKSYKQIQLENGLHALLIHDPQIVVGEPPSSTNGAEPESAAQEDPSADGESDTSDSEHAGAQRAAVAMCVGCGCFNDPMELQGLSHYLEHMLFMGSEDFPNENEFDDFLAKHAGATNAFTDSEYTNYHFDLNPNALYAGLQRFAGFFTKPLCLQSALEREVQAVDSEFTGILQEDDNRLEGLMAYTATRGHPLNRFQNGNRKSLWEEPRAAGLSVRDKIMEHYQKHYSAHVMHLVIMGGQPLDTLEKWVLELFSGVPRLAKSPPSVAGCGPPFSNRSIYLAPRTKAGHVIWLTFCLPPVHGHYRSKSEDFIAHLVGHEGPGSLLSALKTRQWATELVAGVFEEGGSSNDGFSLFQIEITLTDAGLAAAPGLGLACVALVFQYLHMLRSAEPQRWLWDEVRQMAELRFRFQQQKDALESVTQLASEMRLYASEHVLCGRYVYDTWDPERIAAQLALMQPEAKGLRIDVMTSEFESGKKQMAQLGAVVEDTEVWYQLPFCYTAVPDALVSAWAAHALDPSLRLPNANPFIPKNVELIPGAPANWEGDAGDADAGKHDSGAGSPPKGRLTPPSALVDEPGLRVHHKLVTAFETPRAVAMFRLASPVLSDPVTGHAKAQLLVDCWRDVLTELAYQAEQASLNSSVSFEGHLGIEVCIYGFSDRLAKFTAMLFETLSSLSAPHNWTGIKEERIRTTRNRLLNISQHASWMRGQLLIPANAPFDEVVAAMEAVTSADIESFRKKVLHTCHLEVLVEGNMTGEATVDMCRAILAHLKSQPMKAELRTQLHCTQLPASKVTRVHELTLNPDEKNSVVQVYVQFGPHTDNLRAMQMLISRILEEPVYNQLRTQQQLGYSVHSRATKHGAMLGFLVSVTSDKPPESVENAVDEFLTAAEDLLQNLTDDEYAQHVDSLCTLFLEPCKNIKEQVDDHWTHVFAETYDFQQCYQVVQHLRKITKSDVVEVYKQHVCSAESARKLVIRVQSAANYGKLSEGPDWMQTSQIVDFRQQLQMVTPTRAFFRYFLSVRK